ncbi:MAG TPA: lactate racemase domain-containing protein, partial [Bacillota bacterium]|nr:lactate racemase domain-containing protein [Bacillota bacterium]
MQSIKINWQQHPLEVPVPEECEVRVLEPHYPPALKHDEIESVIVPSINDIRDQIHAASQIVLVLEDCSRRTATAPLVEAVYNQLTEIRGGKTGLEVIVAAGAHFNLNQKALARKTGPVPFRVHNAIEQLELTKVGESTSGIPL